MNAQLIRMAITVISLVMCVLMIGLWREDYRQTKLIASFPYAWLILLSVLLAAAPWAKRRFSTGNLLMAMTLFAVFLSLMIGLGFFRQ